MTDHECLWWHWYETGEGRVWDNVYDSPPEDIIAQGYACWCGAEPVTSKDKK